MSVVCGSVRLCVCAPASVYLGVWVSVRLCVCVFVCLCVRLCVCVCASVRPCVCASVRLRLSVTVSVCLQFGNRTWFALLCFVPASVRVKYETLTCGRAAWDAVADARLPGAFRGCCVASWARGVVDAVATYARFF